MVKRQKAKTGQSKKSGGDPGKRLLLQAKVKILKSSKPFSAISPIRESLRPSDYATFLAWLSEQPRLMARTLAIPFPQKHQDLRPFAAPRPLSLSLELRWCYARLEPHLSKLAAFIHLRANIDNAFVKGCGDQCLSLLSEIELSYGTSIWLIKKKVALLQQFQGLEKQKGFADSVKGQSGSFSGIIPYITHYVSYRSEPSVSPITFGQVYEARLRDLDVATYAKAYLRQHISCVSPDTVDDCAGMLCLETAGTAIDSYEMLVLALQLAVTHDLPAVNPLLVSIVTKCADKIADTRLSRMLFLQGVKEDDAIVISPLATEQMESLVSCNKKGQLQAYDKLDGADLDSASRVLSALFLVLANVSGDHVHPPVSQDLHAAIAATLFGEDDRVSGAADILRAAWALEGSSAAHLLRLVLEWSEGAHLDVKGQPEWLLHIAGLGRLTPFELWWIVDPSLRDRYARAFAACDRERMPWLMLEADAPLPAETHSAIRACEFGLWRDMLRSYRAGAVDSALNDAKELFAAENAFLRRQAARTIPSCLLSLDKPQECVSFLAESAIADRSLESIMPILEVVDSLSYEFKASMTGSLAFAVLMDLYVSRSTADVGYIRNYAAEDFLSAHSLNRPSDLRQHAGSYDHSLLTHFLRYMCIESGMDTWVAFGGSQEVANERVAVCQLLAELDPTNKDEYQAEIRDIMRRLTLSKRLREVEQSKIYVDISSVKNVARESLRESVARYMAFVRTGMSPEEKSLLRETRQQVDKGDVEALLSGAFPRNEMTELLESIVARLRDEYVSSSQHGLDGYLSVRVRHGTLAGQLRGPLEAEALVTLRDSKTGKYKANTFWPEELRITGTGQEIFLQNALAKFTENYDALIEDMKSSWIQVRKTPDAPGLINFTLLRPEVDYLSTGIHDDMSLDAFLDYILKYFSSDKLEPSLKNIRQALQNKAKPRVNEMLLALQATVEDALGSDTASKLRAAIGRARTQIQTVLDRITEWFRLSKTEMLREPFSVEEAVNIATASIQASCPDFTTNLVTLAELEHFRISGSLPSFVDLLFLVFENAVRHSQMTPHPVVDIAVSLADDVLHIRTENGLGPGVPGVDAMKAVEMVRQDLRSNVFSQSVKTEGGTGFYKMQKILHHDFCPGSGDRKPSLDFGVSEKSRFYVLMTIPIREWKQRGLDNEDSDY